MCYGPARNTKRHGLKIEFFYLGKIFQCLNETKQNTTKQSKKIVEEKTLSQSKEIKRASTHHLNKPTAKLLGDLRDEHCVAW